MIGQKFSDKGAVAARISLTDEVIVACFALSIAMSGGGLLGEGPLYKFLADRDESTLWLLSVGLPSFLTILVSGTEWVKGKDWGMERIVQFAHFRFWLGFMMLGSWAYIGRVMFFYTKEAIAALAVMAIVGVVASFWFVAENRWVIREAKRLEEERCPPGMAMPSL